MCLKTAAAATRIQGNGRLAAVAPINQEDEKKVVIVLGVNRPNVEVAA